MAERILSGTATLTRFHSARSADSGCNEVYNISQHQLLDIHFIIDEVCLIGHHVYPNDVICCMVLTSVSRKNRRDARPQRKKLAGTDERDGIKEGSSHITKFVKVPDSWFRLRPMAHQRKTWERGRRHRTRDVDAERPSWLFDINEPRDIDDERLAWLLQLTGEDIPPARRFRRVRAQRAARTRRRIGIVSYVVFAFTMKRKCAAERDCVRATTASRRFLNSVGCHKNDDKMHGLRLDSHSNRVYRNVG